MCYKFIAHTAVQPRKDKDDIKIFYLSQKNAQSQVNEEKQEPSYRKQIARQLCTQYDEGIYRPKYYTVTLTVTQGQWKRNHWIDHTRLTISRVVLH